MSRRRASEPKAPPPPRRATAIEKAAVAPAAGGSIALDGGWRAELREVAAGALLRVWRPSGGGSPLELEVRLTETGPVVRARVSALEIESEGDLVARCEAFRVQARQAIRPRVVRHAAGRGPPGGGAQHARVCARRGQRRRAAPRRAGPLELRPTRAAAALGSDRSLARANDSLARTRAATPTFSASIDSDRFARKDEAR